MMARSMDRKPFFAFLFNTGNVQYRDALIAGFNNSSYRRHIKNKNVRKKIILEITFLSQVLNSELAAMTNDSTIAIVAQKMSSRHMSKTGSPNWLKGVKNSQKRKERTNTRMAIRNALLMIPGGQAGESHW